MMQCAHKRHGMYARRKRISIADMRWDCPREYRGDHGCDHLDDNRRRDPSGEEGVLRRARHCNCQSIKCRTPRWSHPPSDLHLPPPVSACGAKAARPRLRQLGANAPIHATHDLSRPGRRPTRLPSCPCLLVIAMYHQPRPSTAARWTAYPPKSLPSFLLPPHFRTLPYTGIDVSRACSPLWRSARSVVDGGKSPARHLTCGKTSQSPSLSPRASAPSSE